MGTSQGDGSIVRSTLIVQAVLVLVTAGFFAATDSVASFVAALYGGAVAVVNAALLAWRLQQGKRHMHADGIRHLKSFCQSGVERLVAVLGLLAVGFGFLKLVPLPLLMGFVAGQVGFILSGLIKTKANN